MSFTLTTLKSSIEGYTQNTDWGTTPQFTDQMNTIIRQAEERINYAVQIANYNTKSDSSSITAPAAVVTIADSETGPIAPIYFRIQSSVGTPANNAWSYLLLKDYNFLQEYAPVDSATGTPKYYAFYNDAQASPSLNTGTFAFAPIPSGNLNCEILYFFEPTSLIDADASVTGLTCATNETITVTTADVAGITIGASVTGIGIISGTTVAGITNATTFTLSQAADATGPTVALTFGNNLTWLSTHGTNALLYACLVEAYTFLKGEQDLMQLYDTKYKEALQTLIMTEQGNYRTSFRDRQRAA